jgi:H+/Cl- antiporter ClcA
MKKKILFFGGNMDEEEVKNNPEQKREHKSRDGNIEIHFHRDQLGTIIWACILIWAGLVFLATYQGWLSTIPLDVSTKFEWVWFNQAWLFVFLGAGAILLVEFIIRLTVLSLRKRSTGNLFLAILLIGIGISAILGIMTLWPVILIAIGLSLIIRNFIQRP